MYNQLLNYIEKSYTKKGREIFDSMHATLYKNSGKDFFSPITYERYSHANDLIRLAEALEIDYTKEVTSKEVYDIIANIKTKSADEICCEYPKISMENVTSILKYDTMDTVNNLMEDITLYCLITQYHKNLMNKAIDFILTTYCISKDTLFNGSYKDYMKTSDVVNYSEKNYFVMKEIIRIVSELDYTLKEALGVRICILDTETAALLPRNYPIQVSWLTCDLNLNPISLEDYYILQDYINPAATKVHHLTREILMTKPNLKEPDEVCAELDKVLPNCIFVAHNASFDTKALTLLYGQASMDLDIMTTLCTLKNKNKLNFLDGAPFNFTLETLYKYYKDKQTVAKLCCKFGLDNDVASHNSIYDVLMLYVILKYNSQLIRMTF